MQAPIYARGITAWMPVLHADHGLAWPHWGILCVS